MLSGSCVDMLAIFDDVVYSEADATAAVSAAAEVKGTAVTTSIADATAEAAYYERMNLAAEAKRARALEPPKAAQIKITPGCLMKASGTFMVTDLDLYGSVRILGRDRFLFPSP